MLWFKYFIYKILADNYRKNCKVFKWQNICQNIWDQLQGQFFTISNNKEL